MSATEQRALASHLRFRIQDGIAAVLLLLASQVVAHLAIFTWFSRFGDTPSFSDGRLLALAVVVGGPIALLGMYLLAVKVGSGRIFDGSILGLGVRRPIGNWVPSTLVALGSVLAVAVAAVLIGGHQPTGAVKYFALLTPPERLAFFLAVVLVGPVAEEFAFRGFLLASVAARWGLPIAAAVSMAAYTALHFPGLSIYQLTPFIALAAGTIWLRVRTESIYPPIVLHAMFNGVGALGPFLAVAR